MNPTTTRRFTIALGLSLFFIAFLWLVLPNPRAKALDTHSVYYVAPSCAGVPTPCYTSIQAAVDAVDAPTDVIKVAAGTYTDVHVHPRHDISTTGVVTQVVYVIKTVTIRGGYTTANWDTPIPDTNLTTLDAQSKGRVLYITGNISVTIEGLRLTGGNSTGLGGRPTGEDAGGGVYGISATVSLNHNRIDGNNAFSGGGLWFHQSTATIRNNTISSNSGTYCSGLRLQYSYGTVQDNTIISNTSPSGGDSLCFANATGVLDRNTVSYNSNLGGLNLDQSTVTLTSNTVANNAGLGIVVNNSDATLTGNVILSNTTGVLGGGIFANNSAITLTNNTVAHNISAGIIANNSAATLVENIILSNTNFAGDGGGVSLWTSSAYLERNTISGNISEGGEWDTGGGGIYIDASPTILYKNRITRNQGFGDGGGVYTRNSPVTLTDNLIAENTTSGSGGGLSIDHGRAMLTGNAISSNTSGDCGGLCLSGEGILSGNTIISNTARGYEAGGGDAGGCGGLGLGGNWTLVNNTILSNTTPGRGGGLCTSWAIVTASNTIIAYNQAGTGSGLSFENSQLQLAHTTLAWNQGADGVGVYGTNNIVYPNIAVMTNTILTGHTIGITVSTGTTIILEGTLWYSNTQDWSGAGIILTGTHNFWGDPAFINPKANDFHITAGSAAIDRGIPTWAAIDIDNEPRLGIPDLGVDEYWAPGALPPPLYLPVIYGSTAVDPYRVYYVAPPCVGVPVPCYVSIQDAVDAVDLPNEVVKVAAGIYRDVHVRPKRDFETTGVVTQVLYINKSVIIQGGYAKDNWLVADPEANPTLLDAQGQGRVIYVTSDADTSIEGLRLTGGTAAGLGGSGSDRSVGGGLYASGVTIQFRHNRVFGNAEGGIYAIGNLVHLSENVIDSNTSPSSCGVSALNANSGLTEIVSNTISFNADWGLCVGGNTAAFLIEGNTIVGNHGEAGLDIGSK